MENYETQQINGIGESSSYKIKITGLDGETNWLSISKSDLEKIKEIFA